MGYYIENAIDWVVYKPQKCISYKPAGWKSKVSMTSRSGSGECLLPGLRLWAYHYALPEGRESLLSGDPYKDTNPITGAPPS